MCCYVKPKLRKATEVPSVQMCAAFLNVQSQNVRGIFSGTQHAATTPERRIEDHSIWTGIDHQHLRWARFGRISSKGMVQYGMDIDGFVSQNDVDRWPVTWPNKFWPIPENVTNNPW